ncbi:MAG: glycosyltransferase family 2 protein [Sphingobacteriales bacterium]|nr:glycosyltransferase family 2 protein [Sphingobacteriales bacterium]
MTTTAIIAYSIVIPVYNAEATLATLLARIQAVMDPLSVPYEVIFVEDRGGDNSWELIRDLYEQYPQIVCGVRLSRNFGQHAATLCGLHIATGEWVITLDDDLQLPPEAIPQLIDRQRDTQADCVYGIYTESHQPFIRKMGSRLMQYVMRQTFACSVDVSSFRLLRRELVQKMLRHRQGLLFLDGLIGWHTQDVAAATVTRQKRQYGQSGYNLWSLAALLLHLIFNYTLFPLRIAFGLGCLSLGLGIAFYLRWLPIPLGKGLSITQALVGSVWIVGGLLGISIAIAVAYLLRIYVTVQQKPLFSVRETLPPSE